MYQFLVTQSLLKFMTNRTTYFTSPFLGGNFPCATFSGVYISQLIRVARASSKDNDFNNRNKISTAKNSYILKCKGTITINYVKYFLNFIAVILNYVQI